MDIAASRLPSSGYLPMAASFLFAANLNEASRKRQITCFAIRDFPIAVVEAKADYKQPGDGLAQAKDYAQTLDIKFAYSTNGTGIIEFDFPDRHRNRAIPVPVTAGVGQRLNQTAKLTDQQQEQLSKASTCNPARFRGTTRRLRSTASSRRRLPTSLASC
ncbi:MAG: hypothetical protein R3B90_00180 [Planctomycetaceae bacterium]